MSDSILPSAEEDSDAETPEFELVSDAVEDPLRVGPYRLGEILGRGGMGVVYRAHHTELELDRALKLMSRPENPKGVARFRREANNLARVRHPNVVHIYEFGEHEGKLFFAMEYVEGTPLDKLLSRGPLPLPKALRLLVRIAEGVGALHEAGVIHRDLKPGNVVVAGERPVVLDLGLAVNPELDQRLTKTDATLGTVEYMAPEQIKSAKQVTPATDVYALGLLLFELVTGEPVHDRTLDHHLLATAITAGRTRAPSKVNPDLPLALDTLCARALALDPADRWPNAEALAKATQAVLERPGPTRRQEQAKLIAVCAAGLIGLAVGLFFALPRADPLAPLSDIDPAEVDLSPVSSKAATLSDRELREARSALRPIVKPHGLPPERRYAAARSWLSAYPTHPDRAQVEAAIAQALLHVPFDALPHAGVRAALFVRDGEQVLSAGGTTLRLWDVGQGAVVRRWTLASSAWALAVREERFAVGGDGSTIAVGTLGSEKTLTLKRSHPRYRVRSLAFAPDGRLLACASHRGVEVFDLSTQETVQTFGPLVNPVIAVGISGDGSRLVTLSGFGRDGLDGREKANMLTIWDLATGESVASQPFMAMPQGLAFAGDGTTFALSTDGRRLLTYDVSRAEQIRELTAPGVTPGVNAALRAAHDGVIRSVAIPAKRDRLISVSGTRGAPRENNQIRIWDLRSGERLHTVEARPAEMLWTAASPEGSQFLICVPGAVELWDVSALDAQDPHNR